MYVGELRLLNFRVYRELALQLEPGVNLLLGHNGQGKTSLLEAIATLALTRSPRSSSLGECATWGESRMGVSAHLVTRSGETELDLRVERSEQSSRWVRRLRLGGDQVARRELLGRFRVVVFWPEDLFLVKGGPEPRRRMLDVALSQLSPDYAEAAIRFRRVLEHRTVLLRQVRERRASRAELEPWTEALVEHGATLMRQRTEYLRDAAPVASEAILKMGETAELSLEYRPGLGSEDGAQLEPADALARALSRVSAEEMARCQCVVGPHRDDFEVRLGGRSARQYASQGQQRSAALALKVAEVRQHLAMGGDSPVLLLDDVLSELDEERRDGLVKLLSEELAVDQTLITSAGDPKIAGEVRLAQLLLARGGGVTPQPEGGWEES